MESDPGEETGEGSHYGGVEILGVLPKVFLCPALDVVTYPHHSHLQVSVIWCISTEILTTLNPTVLPTHLCTQTAAVLVPEAAPVQPMICGRYSHRTRDTSEQPCTLSGTD